MSLDKMITANCLVKACMELKKLILAALVLSKKGETTFRPQKQHALPKLKIVTLRDCHDPRQLNKRPLMANTWPCSKLTRVVISYLDGMRAYVV